MAAGAIVRAPPVQPGVQAGVGSAAGVVTLTQLRRVDHVGGQRRPGGDCSDPPPSAPPAAHDLGALIDAHGRTIRDLRVSITDRCNFRCAYCMEPSARFAEHSHLLTVDEIVRLCRIAAGLGITKVRLTGGEPTLHPDLLAIIAGIRAAAPVEIAMTTNGSLIDDARAAAWKQAGLDRVSVSLDSLQPGRFTRLSRSACSPQRVLDGARACIDAGLTPLKINCVLVRGINDDEPADLAGLARSLGVEVRFIEYMPLDTGGGWGAQAWVSAAETRRRVEARYALEPCADEPASTARTFRFADGAPGRVGFIAPLSTPFCGACSRLRVTADGRVRPCLFSQTEWDVRPLLRGTNARGDEQIRAFLVNAAWAKPRGHDALATAYRRPARGMGAIGG